jgi:hypothetical protein
MKQAPLNPELQNDRSGPFDVIGRNLLFSVGWVKPDSELAPGKILTCPPQSFVEQIPDGKVVVLPNEAQATPAKGGRQ